MPTSGSRCDPDHLPLRVGEEAEGHARHARGGLDDARTEPFRGGKRVGTFSTPTKNVVSALPPCVGPIPPGIAFGTPEST